MLPRTPPHSPRLAHTVSSTPLPKQPDCSDFEIGIDRPTGPMKRVLWLQLLAATALLLALAWGPLLPLVAAAADDEDAGDVMEALKEAVEVSVCGVVWVWCGGRHSKPSPID